MHMFVFCTGLTHNHSDTHSKALGLNGATSLTVLNEQLNEMSQGHHDNSLSNGEVQLIPISIIISPDCLRT